MTIQDLIKDYNELRVGLQKLMHELDRHYSEPSERHEDDRFVQVMSVFRDQSIEKFDQLEVRYTSMDIAYKDVVTFFGENPRDMKPDEFFGIFKTFTSSWEVTWLGSMREYHRDSFFNLLARSGGYHGPTQKAGANRTCATV